MNKFCSIFSQVFQLFPRFEFQQLVKETRTEHHAHGFSWQSQVGSNLFPCFFANWGAQIACTRLDEPRMNQG